MKHWFLYKDSSKEKIPKQKQTPTDYSYGITWGTIACGAFKWSREFGI